MFTENDIEKLAEWVISQEKKYVQKMMGKTELATEEKERLKRLSDLELLQELGAN